MTTFPKLITSNSEMIEWRRSVASKRIGLVATMGGLHAGHGTLLNRLRDRCDISVLSIFVNPTQFGPKEDYTQYPRNLEADLKLATREKVDVIFAPQASEIYPPGFSVFLEETVLSQPLCGLYRPGHFRGVTTVVLKLFNLIQPRTALFGLKDAQQFFILEKMVKDLNLDIRIEGIATVREQDGLAMSSRNNYLTQEERVKAPKLHEILSNIQNELELQSTPNAISEILSSGKKRLMDLGFWVQYFDWVSLPYFQKNFSQLDSKSPYLLAAAAFLGKTRLIDNAIIRAERLEEHGIYWRR